jgi:hypothetical protein
MDAIEPVAKGELGADVIQQVNGAVRQAAGMILWESKRTKAWSDGWLAKLREDQRRCGADVALIISLALPSTSSILTCRCALPVAVALRHSLIELSSSKLVQQGQQTKMEQVYEYLTGSRFRQRVDAVVEKFNDMREDLDKERKFMGRQWAKRETQIVASLNPPWAWWATCRLSPARRCRKSLASRRQCLRGQEKPRPNGLRSPRWDKEELPLPSPNCGRFYR